MSDLSPEPDALSKAFAEAAELSGAARARYIEALRATDPATAAEVASLLDYHADESGTKAEPDGTAGMPSLLDRPAAALLGLSLSGEAVEGTEEDPALPEGTLLSTEGMTEIESDATPAEAPWTYRIEREIGRGGMGIVYRAEQSFPSRMVALKLLRGGAGHAGTTVPSVGSMRSRRGESAGMGGGGDTAGRTKPSNIAGVAMGAARRLILEAEALGTLHDPGIAHVYAAGTLRVLPGEDGTPVRGPVRRLFMAMELVEGPTLGEWAKGRSLREKVSLLADVCDAIEHAHRRGVVHRDIKPGNVLVDLSGGGATPQAKVLDFGVARLTGRARADRPDATLNVARGQLVGTLRYMSPEQARGGATGGPDVDSRSDVYSLGAVLYELITGAPPIPVDDASIVGAVERIATATPARPVGLAAQLGKRTGGDLETVVLKALEKAPADRYQHASDLAADLRRVLADEPITARPPTASEQLMRLVRRNRVAAGAIAAGLLLLLAGASVATWQAVRATRALEQAKSEAEVSRSALRFMQRMIDAGSPDETRGQDVTVREMLKAAVIEVRSMPDDRATATACRLLAEAVQEVGEPVTAEPLARRALAINRVVRGEDDGETIESGLLAAHIAAQRGQPDALKEAREWRDRVVGLMGPDARLSLRAAMVLEYCLDPNVSEQARESEALLNDTIERMTRVHGRHDRVTLSALSDLAALYLNLQRGAEALPLTQEVYEARKDILGEDHPETIVSLGNLTAALANMGQFDRALELNARNVALAEKVFGPDHPSTQYARSNLAQLLLRQSRFKEAEAQARAVWEARSRRLGPNTRLALQAQGLMIACVMSQGKERFDEAEQMVRAFIARNEELFGPKDDDTLQAVTLLYDLAEGKGDKATMAAVTERLKGTRFDPTNAVQQPAVGTVPDESGKDKKGQEKP
ncbi:MAG: serine/threonine-protein kinase [Phycisphaerales bacterium]